jgi:MFS family permease
MTEVLTSSQRRRSLSAVIANVFGVGVTMGATTPLMTFVLEERGVDTVLIGLNSAMFPLAVMLAAPFLPRLAGRLGSVRSMYLGIAVAIVSVLLLPVFPDLGAWFVLRFLCGLGLSLHWVVSETWINTVATESNRGRIMGIYTTVITAGFGIGPLILNWTGTEGALPFIVGAAAVACSAVPISLAHDVAPDLAQGHEHGFLATALRSPGLMGIALFAGLIETALYVMMPVYALHSAFNQDQAIIVLSIFVAGNVVMQIPIGILADAWDRRKALMTCAALSLIGTILMPLLLDTQIWLAILLFIWGGVAFGTYALSLTLLGQSFPTGQLASANAAFIMTYELGSVAGPVIAGSAMDLWDPHGMLVVVALASLIFVALAARWRAPPQSPAAKP